MCVYNTKELAQPRTVKPCFAAGCPSPHRLRLPPLLRQTRGQNC